MAYDVDPFLVPTEYAGADLKLGKRNDSLLEDAASATEVEHFGLQSAFPALARLDYVLE